MASSYDKINHSFLKSLEWRDYTAKFRQMCAGARIERASFSRQQNYSTGVPEISVCFELDFGGVGVSRGSLDNFTFPSGDALTDEYLNQMVAKNFGQRGYPTYFCKRDKVEKKWPEYARARLVEANKDVVLEMEARLVAQWKAMRDSDELRAEKQRFYERGVIDEIKKVVLKYYGKVTPEVLKEALDEVVAHAIMES